MRCPLTGTELPAGVDLNRPALAVKIDNHPRARPPAGLESADIVYEELVEGGLTRFMGIYHCGDAEDLGPVRSAREVDPDILVQYEPALFAYSGASPNNLRKVRSTAGVVDLVHGSNGPAYSRRRGRPAPHNLFTSTGSIRARPAAQGVNGPPETGLEFDPDLNRDRAPADKESPSPAATPLDGPAPAPAAGNKVTFSYSGGAPVTYTYDPSTGRYLRAVGGAPHLAATGEQLSAANVVVMKVEVSRSGSSPHIAVAGAPGEAIVLRNGEAIHGEWIRRTFADQTVLVGDDGKPILLKPGPTWINLLPSDRPATVE